MSDHRLAIAEVFGRAAATYDSVIPFFAPFGERLVALADLRAGERVLDVACGTGATLLPAAERVGSSGLVVGGDLAEEMVALLGAEVERRRLANASVRRMDAEALDVTDASFDVVLSGFTLHLLPSPGAGAAEFRRALRPGGRCVASVPAGEDAHWAFLRELYTTFVPRATKPMVVPMRPRFDVEQVLVGAGLEVARSSHVEEVFVLPDEEAWWRWAWSHGMRGLLEVLPPADLEELRGWAFRELRALRTAEGLSLRQGARMVVATRPLSG